MRFQYTIYNSKSLKNAYNFIYLMYTPSKNVHKFVCSKYIIVCYVDIWGKCPNVLEKIIEYLNYF